LAVRKLVVGWQVKKLQGKRVEGAITLHLTRLVGGVAKTQLLP